LRSADLRICGSADLQICRSEDFRICGSIRCRMETAFHHASSAITILLLMNAKLALFNVCLNNSLPFASLRFPSFLFPSLPFTLPLYDMPEFFFVQNLQIIKCVSGSAFDSIPGSKAEFFEVE
jgi:hypothetical protein